MEKVYNLKDLGCKENIATFNKAGEKNRELFITLIKNEETKVVEGWIKEISLLSKTQQITTVKDAPAEQIATAKEMQKQLKGANRKVASLSGVCRIFKEFKTEYKAVLDYYNLKPTPSSIKAKWNKDLAINGRLFEKKRRKNPLFDAELKKKFKSYPIEEYLEFTSEVTSFTINKVLKYCK